MPLETAETGSIGSGSDRDDHVSRRTGCWSCVREKAIEVKRIGQKTYPLPFTFSCYTRTNIPELNSRAAVRRRAAAITRNFFAATGNFQARVQCFLKLPCFLPQKQEVSGAVATETTMFQGERVVGHACWSCIKTIIPIELPTAPILCPKMQKSAKKRPQRAQKAKGIPPLQKNIRI